MKMKLNDIYEIIIREKYSHIVITGHIHADGDCIGACLSMRRLLMKMGIYSQVVLTDCPSTYDYLLLPDEVVSEVSKVDLLIVCDNGDPLRVNAGHELIGQADCVINIDHHISNTHYGNYNQVIDISSTCEVIGMMIHDWDLVDENIAAALYTGIIYDTGVFKHSNTTEQTMMLAGKLLTKGIQHTDIINRLFNTKSLSALKITGKAFENIMSYMGNRVIVSYITMEDMLYFGADKKDTEGIVQMLLEVEMSECSVFLYPLDDSNYKVSLRAIGQINVCEIAKIFGGGGHTKAAGCTLAGNHEVVIKKIIHEILKQVNYA